MGGVGWLGYDMWLYVCVLCSDVLFAPPLQEATSVQPDGAVVSLCGREQPCVLLRG